MVPWFRGEVGRARAAVVAFFVLAGFSFSAWAVRIPDVKAELGLDDATLGLALLGTAAGSVVAMTASGWTIARFGSRRVTTVTALLTCVTMVLPPLAPSAPLLFAALFIFGAAYGALDVAMNAKAATVDLRTLVDQLVKLGLDFAAEALPAVLTRAVKEDLGSPALLEQLLRG